MYRISERFPLVWQQFFKGHHNIWVTFRHAVLKFLRLTISRSRVKGMRFRLRSAFTIKGTWETFPSKKRLHWVDLNLSFDADAYEWEIKKRCRHSRISFVVTTRKKSEKKDKKKTRLEKERQARMWEKEGNLKSFLHVVSCIVRQLQHHLMFSFGYCFADHYARRDNDISKTRWETCEWIDFPEISRNFQKF